MKTREQIKKALQTAFEQLNLAENKERRNYYDAQYTAFLWVLGD